MSEPTLPQPVVVNIGGARAAVPAGRPAVPTRVPRGYLGGGLRRGELARLPAEQLALLRWLMQVIFNTACAGQPLTLTLPAAAAV